MNRSELILIKFASKGDVLRTTCLLPALKEKFPFSRIAWVVEKGNEEVLKNNPLIDQIFVYHHRLPQQFKGRRFVQIINLDEDPRACRLASSLKGEICGLYSKGKRILPTQTARYWFEMNALGEHPRNDKLKKSNKKTYQQIMFDIAGLRTSRHRPIFVVEERGLEFAGQFASQNSLKKNDLIIGLNTGAGKKWQCKKWPIKKTAHLADLVHKKLKAKLILFGGPGEILRNGMIKSQVRAKIIDAGCKNSLMEFASLVNLCDLLVVSDSLALHLAVALKKKVISLFGPTSSSEIDLYGRGQKVISPLDCTCCYRIRCNKRPNCMDTISVEMVFNSICRLCE